MLGNLSAYIVLPHVSKALLFAVFTSVAAAGSASLLLLRRIASYDTPVYMPLVKQEHEEVLLDTLPRRNPWQRVQGAVQLVYGSIWRDVIVLFPNLRILMLCPMFFWTGFELAFWTGEFPQLLDSSVQHVCKFERNEIIR